MCFVEPLKARLELEPVASTTRNFSLMSAASGYQVCAVNVWLDVSLAAHWLRERGRGVRSREIIYLRDCFIGFAVRVNARVAQAVPAVEMN